MAWSRSVRIFRKQKPLLIPAQWAGSVEHYYHFLLGYLLPVVTWLEDKGRPTCTLRDCGPMNPWLTLIGTRYDFELVPPGLMLHSLVTKRQPHVVLPTGDNPAHFREHRLRNFALVMAEIAGVTGHNDQPPVVLLNRGNSDPHYQDPRTEIATSGAQRRSIPNINEIMHSFDGSTLVDTAELTPAEQIKQFSGARVLVGQHGAGLANMLWMPKGSSVVEIKPPLGKDEDFIFKNLAVVLGHNYISVSQESLHAPVDVNELTKAFEAVT